MTSLKEAKSSNVAPKASTSKSNSAAKKPAQRSQDPPKKVQLLVNYYMILIFKHGLSLRIMESYSLILGCVEERGQVCCEELNEEKAVSICFHAKENYFYVSLLCYVYLLYFKQCDKRGALVSKIKICFIYMAINSRKSTCRSTWKNISTNANDIIILIMFSINKYVHIYLAIHTEHH